MTTVDVQAFVTVERGSWSAHSGWRAVYLLRDDDGRIELAEWPLAGWAVADGAVWPVVVPEDAAAPGVVLAGSSADPRAARYLGTLAPAQTRTT